jgi:hypothetical protein
VAQFVDAEAYDHHGEQNGVQEEVPQLVEDVAYYLKDKKD